MSRRQGKAIRRLAYSRADAALDARFDAEREFSGRPEIEVVVLGADSWEALAWTHSRYFKGVRELAEVALAREESLGIMPVVSGRHLIRDQCSLYDQWEICIRRSGSAGCPAQSSQSGAVRSVREKTVRDLCPQIGHGRHWIAGRRSPVARRPDTDLSVKGRPADSGLASCRTACQGSRTPRPGIDLLPGASRPGAACLSRGIQVGPTKHERC